MNQELCMDKKNMKLKVNREPITDDSGDPFENVFLGVLSSNYIFKKGNYWYPYLVIPLPLYLNSLPV